MYNFITCIGMCVYLHTYIYFSLYFHKQIKMNENLAIVRPQMMIIVICFLVQNRFIRRELVRMYGSKFSNLWLQRINLRSIRVSVTIRNRYR